MDTSRARVVPKVRDNVLDQTAALGLLRRQPREALRNLVCAGRRPAQNLDLGLAPQVQHVHQLATVCGQFPLLGPTYRHSAGRLVREIMLWAWAG